MFTQVLNTLLRLEVPTQGCLWEVTFLQILERNSEPSPMDCVFSKVTDVKPVILWNWSPRQMFYQKSSGRFKLQVSLKTIDVNVLEKALKNKDINHFW